MPKDTFLMFFVSDRYDNIEFHPLFKGGKCKLQWGENYCMVRRYGAISKRHLLKLQRNGVSIVRADAIC